jgi:hypothetical protein
VTWKDTSIVERRAWSAFGSSASSAAGAAGSGRAGGDVSRGDAGTGTGGTVCPAAGPGTREREEGSGAAGGWLRSDAGGTWADGTRADGTGDGAAEGGGVAVIGATGSGAACALVATAPAGSWLTDVAAWVEVCAWAVCSPAAAKCDFQKPQA